MSKIRSPSGKGPSIWRTCRVLANRNRLTLYCLLAKNQPGTVTELADQAGLSVSLASNYLRQLNARGLLQATRRRGHVEYHILPDPAVPFAADLTRALADAIRHEADPVTFIYRHATAFGHPRRQMILRALAREGLNRQGLSRATGIPRMSLHTHLVKLKSRGYLSTKGNHLRLIPPRKPLPAVLLRWTLKGF